MLIKKKYEINRIISNSNSKFLNSINTALTFKLISITPYFVRALSNLFSIEANFSCCVLVTFEYRDEVISNIDQIKISQVSFSL